MIPGSDLVLFLSILQKQTKTGPSGLKGTMIKRWHRIILALVISLAMVTCIDPYTPQLKTFESRLVVDALLTDEITTAYVRLSRSTLFPDGDPKMVSGATVKITDDLGTTAVLVERGPGDYHTDSLTFRAETGRSYQLTIETRDGNKYESDPCLMRPVPEIDSLYYGVDQVFSEQTGEFREGISFFIDTKNEEPGSYYRWAFEEWWKFSVPDPAIFRYFNDSTIVPLQTINRTCFAHTRSDIIDIENTISGHIGDFIKKPVLFIASDESDRLLIRYCLAVKQMSLSRQEYEFWHLMTEINEAGGDIFDKQPFQVFSNIRNISDPDDQVIGYFQVSGVKEKRIYVTAGEAAALNLPMYIYECDRQEKGEVDYPPTSPGEGFTFNEIYAAFLNSGYAFVGPIFDKDNLLFRLIFARPHCADCTLRGSPEEPWFWEDPE